MRKIVLSVMVVAFSLALASTSFAKKGKYKEGRAGSGSITGTVSLKGTPMAPIIEDLTKFGNDEFCTTHPDAKDGKRVQVKVVVSGGKLKDAVVFIEEIKTGKPWYDLGTFSFDFEKCDIKPKMTAVRIPSKAQVKTKTGLFKIVNRDPIEHRPYAYQIKGPRGSLVNLKSTYLRRGSVADFTPRIRRGYGKHFFLRCTIHKYMEANALIVWNPYFSVTGAGGAFSIDGIPVGKYKVTAWHPFVGEFTQEVRVGDGAVKVGFTLTPQVSPHWP